MATRGGGESEEGVTREGGIGGRYLPAMVVGKSSPSRAAHKYFAGDPSRVIVST